MAACGTDVGSLENLDLGKLKVESNRRIGVFGTIKSSGK